MEIKKKGSRNSDKRRERSKVAARCRRGKESEIFSELASCLPLPDNVRCTLDKASIARLALTTLKLKDMLFQVFGGSNSESDSSANMHGYDAIENDGLLNQAMGGFIFVISGDGDVTYISESITKILGLSQCEVMGQSIFDFAHPCDHEDIKDLLKMNKSTPKDYPISRCGFFRMKCTITSKGRNVHLRAATFKGMSCTGRLYWSEKDSSRRWYVGLAEPLSDPTDVTFPLNKQAFVTRHSMDMKCEDVAGDIGDFLGYKSQDLIGKSFYEMHHAADGLALGKHLKALYSKGQIQTERYRFLAKTGGWVWCITQATVLKSESGSKPNGIVCLHFVTSGIENGDEILSGIQSKPTGITRCHSPLLDIESIRLPDILANAIHSTPIPSTTKIFAPRTEDMDSGFLVPFEDDTLIVSKEEPEDLTHLAPIAGDECVALDVPLLDDLLKSFDAANLGYKMNGFLLEVDSYQMPVINFEDFQNPNFFLSESSIPLLIDKDNGSDTLYPRESSPLLLDSDPVIGGKITHGHDTEKTFGVQDNPKPFSITKLEDEFGLKIPDSSYKDSLNSDLPDELSEFRAPYIPTDGGEEIELMSSLSDLIWPNLITLPAVDTLTPEIPPELPTSSNTLSPPPKNEFQTRQSKLSDQNIDQISWTLDIASIFAARKPGDKPRVSTNSIFTHLEPPPVKLRKISTQCGQIDINNGIENGETISGVTNTTLAYSKCPFLKTYQSKVRERVMDKRGQQLHISITSGSDASLRSSSHQVALQDVFARKRTVSGSLLAGRGGIDKRHSCLYELSPEDYELMAPLLETSLLEGSDLLSALDSVLGDSSTSGFLRINPS